MTREIKIQAWDTDTNQFVPCENHTIGQMPNHYAGLGNRYVYREFIGLLDKNGKEIYEGDVVKYAKKRILL